MALAAPSQLRPECLEVDEIVLIALRLRDNDMWPVVGVVWLILELP